MKCKKIILIALFFLIGYILIQPIYVQAQQDAIDRLDAVAKDTYKTDVDQATIFPETIGLIVNVLLSLLGVIFIVLMIYAGYNWMIARGEEEKVTTAKNTMRSAIIGLIIVLGSYAIWEFIYEYFIIGGGT